MNIRVVLLDGVGDSFLNMILEQRSWIELECLCSSSNEEYLTVRLDSE